MWHLCQTSQRALMPCSVVDLRVGCLPFGKSYGSYCLFCVILLWVCVPPIVPALPHFTRHGILLLFLLLHGVPVCCLRSAGTAAQRAVESRVSGVLAMLAIPGWLSLSRRYTSHRPTWWVFGTHAHITPRARAIEFYLCEHDQVGTTTS